MAAPYPQQAPPTYAPYPQQAPPPQYAPQPPVQQTGLPVAGGILLIIVGVIYLVCSALIMATPAWMIGMIGFSLLGLESIFVVLGLIGIVFSILVILGGYFAMQRTHFGLAIVAGVLALPSILGLIGLILIAVAHKEFH